MSFFSYRIVDASGNVRTGRIEKESIAEAKAALAEEDGAILSISPLSLWEMDIAELSPFRQRTGKREIALFCRQLSFLLDAGVRMTDAFEMLVSAVKAGDFRDALAAVRSGLQKGETLSDCFKKHSVFPRILAGVAQIGEMSGRLPVILEKIAVYYENEVQTEDELKNAMIYPALVSLMMLGVMVVAVVYVVPNYVQLFVAGGISLPVPTRALIALSDFFRDWYAYLLGLVVVSVVGAYVFFRTPRGQLLLDGVRLRIPVYRSLYRKRLNLRFAQCLGVMLEAGQPLIPSLSAVKPVMGNLVIEQTIEDLLVKLKEGTAFWKCLEEADCFEPMMCGMVMMGEETGGLAQVLDRCGVYFQRETDMMVVKLNKIVDPAVTIVLGLVLAFLMLAVMLPTFALTDIM